MLTYGNNSNQCKLKPGKKRFKTLYLMFESTKYR